ncbi:MAG TPA: VTT domain-containing protein [Kofleriaceae bacterium]|nr:VTT domain-containing protein [Kofleriaceae bacterium]
MALSRAGRRIVLGVLVVAFVAGAVYLWRTGGVTASGVRRWIDSLGPAAPVLYIGAFVAGGLVGLPGMAFVMGGRLAFGPWWGGLLAYTAGMCAITVPFVAARLLRRQQAVPWRPKQKLAARAMDMIETHPIRAVWLMRIVLWFNPPLSYALALTPIRLRDYLLGCALALAPVVAIAMIASSWLL